MRLPNVPSNTAPKLLSRLGSSKRSKVEGEESATGGMTRIEAHGLPKKREVVVCLVRMFVGRLRFAGSAASTYTSG